MDSFQKYCARGKYQVTGKLYLWYLLCDNHCPLASCESIGVQKCFFVFIYRGHVLEDTNYFELLSYKKI